MLRNRYNCLHSSSDSLGSPPRGTRTIKNSPRIINIPVPVIILSFAAIKYGALFGNSIGDHLVLIMQPYYLIITLEYSAGLGCDYRVSLVFIGTTLFASRILTYQVSLHTGTPNSYQNNHTKNPSAPSSNTEKFLLILSRSYADGHHSS
jgi:hypothetical protein